MAQRMRAVRENLSPLEMLTRIIDNGTGRDRSVIIHMGRKDSESATIAQRVAGAIGHRRMAASARDLLPEPAMREVKRSTYQRRKYAARRSSTSAQVAAAMVASPQKAQLKQASQHAMSPLLRHSSVQAALAASSDGTTDAGFWTSNSLALTLPTDDLVSILRDVDGITGIYPNRTLSVPQVVEVSSLPQNVTENKTSSWGLQAINAMASWGAYGARGAGVTVGVLDTGIDAEHPDLEGKVSAWAEFDQFGQRVIGSTAHDTDEHGTHVAGTIAGGNASGHWIGVAPEAKIAAGLVIDGRIGGTDAQILAGINWAIDIGVDVINMSLGGITIGPVIEEVYTEAILTALQAGIPVVVAIGNDGEQTTGSPGNDLFSFAIGATDWNDRPAAFSGGRTQALIQSQFIGESNLPVIFSKPDVSAPGVAVESSVPNGEYKMFSGTSMATPHVAGACAVLLSATDKLASVPDDERAFVIQDLLTGSVEELGEHGQDHRFGFGRIDTLRAIGYAAELGYT